MKPIQITIAVAALLLQACASAPSPVTATQASVLGSDLDSLRELMLQSAAEQYRYDQGAARLRDDGYAAAPTRNPLTCTAENHSNAGRNNPVSVDFFEMDLREALLEMSIMADFPIIVDDTIAGYVSLSLWDATLETALEMVLATGDYSFRFYDNYVLVGASTVDSPSFAKLATTCRYKPMHTSPLDLAGTLSPYFQQFVRVPQQADYLTITAPINIQQQIGESLKVFDEAPGQVLLEMTVVEVSREALDILGVAWDGVARDPNTGDRRSFGAAEWAGLTAQQALANAGIFYGLMPQRTLAQSVQALQASGEAAIKAMPSIVSLDGQEALFSSTQTVWLPYANASSSSTDRRNELSYGVEMKLIPRISVNGQVTLNIVNATVSDLADDQHDQPRLISHSISNTVNVQDGDYLILGGLLQKKLRSNESGLPVNSGFNKLNFLNGKDEVREEETEVLIMIRPQILQG